MSRNRASAALKASCIHLTVTGCIASLAAAVIFLVWFPYPYRELAGGLHLFWVVVGVDVVCGPLLTAILFNPKKSRKELTLDLSLISLLQVAALVYGMYSISAARPIALVFEVDRFVAVTAAQISPQDLKKVAPEYRQLPLNGKLFLLSVRAPENSAEALDSLSQSILGIEPSARPNWWQSYEKSRKLAQSRMKRLVDLRPSVEASGSTAIDRAVAQSGLSINELFYLPLVSQKSLDQWIALLDSNASVVGYVPVGGFER